MEYVVIALLIVAVFAFVAYPLFNPPREKPAVLPGALDALLAQRDAAYDALRDLDFDLQMGKLSAADHAALREKYKARAAAILQQIDAARGDAGAPELDAAIETQVAQLRRAKTDALEAEIARVRAARQAGASRCAKCGTPFRAGDKFCAKCGKPL